MLDIHDLAIARQQGADLVAIGALVGRPLAALIAQPGIARPRDLEGRTVGVSGLPSDPAFLRAIVEHDGADYARVKQVTIGFAAVSRLLTTRVDAVPAFWNAEGVALKQRGLAVREFRVDAYGAPPYPEVVLITSRKTLQTRRDRLQRTLAAIEDGLDDTLAHPRRRRARDRRVPRRRATSRLVRAQLDAVAPVFARGLRLDRGVVRALGRLRRARSASSSGGPTCARAFDFSLAG